LANPRALTKIMRKKKQINKIKDEKGDIVINTNEIQRVIREYCKTLYTNINYKSTRNGYILDVHDITKLTQEDISHLYRSITSNEIESIIKSPNKKSPELDVFTAKFYKIIKEQLASMFFKYFYKTERAGMLATYYISHYYPVTKLDKDTTKKNKEITNQFP
jgi:hypothetical protein